MLMLLRTYDADVCEDRLKNVAKDSVKDVCVANDRLKLAHL